MTYLRIGEDMEKLTASVDNLNTSVQDFSASSNKVSNQVFYLNVVLTVATVVGAIATALMAYKAIFP